jgi:hypothetical protein
MSEVTPNTPPPNTPPTGQVKFADKFDSPEAFEKGFREGSAKAGFAITDKVKLYGEGGMFADIKAAEAGYKTIERLITAKGQEGTPANQGQPTGQIPIPQDEVPLDDDADVVAIVKKAGLDSADLGRTFLEQGKLTDDQYAKLKKAMPGANKKVIDTVIASQIEAGKSKWDAAVKEGETIAGSREQLDVLMQWAGTNMDKNVLAPLKERAKSDPSFYPGFVKLIKGQYAQENGQAPSGQGVGPRSGATGAPAINTRADFKALMARVNAGDPTAKKQLATLDISQFTAL